jgi:cell division protein FtsW
MKNLIRAEILLVVVLMILGALLVLSASGTYSAEKFDNLYFLFKSHISKIIIAIALLVITAMIPYDLYRKYSKHILVGTILLLAATLKELQGGLIYGLFNFSLLNLLKLFC